MSFKEYLKKLEEDTDNIAGGYPLGMFYLDEDQISSYGNDGQYYGMIQYRVPDADDDWYTVYEEGPYETEKEAEKEAFEYIKRNNVEYERKQNK